MKILINQVGYSLQTGTDLAPCRAVVQGRASESMPESIRLRDSEGSLLASFTPEPSAQVAGWKDRFFSILNFQAPEGGPFTLEAASGEVQVVSAPFRIGVDLEAKTTASDILFGIFTYRSSGISDAVDQNISFFGDRKDSVDVHGGWYDASGDTSKYLSHLSYANYMNPQQTPLVVWCLIDAYEQLARSRFPLEERLSLRFLEEAAWGADFLMRMLDPDGYFYTTVFDDWSKNLDRRCICAFRTQKGILSDDYQAGYRQGGGMAIAALARMASLLNGLDIYVGSYTPDEYLDAAYKAWKHLEKHNIEYLDDGKENMMDDYCALLAAAELNSAVSNPVMKTKTSKAVDARTKGLIERWDVEGGFFRADAKGEWSWFHASDESLPLIVLMRAVETGVVTGDLEISARLVVQQALDAEIQRSAGDFNPFLHPRHFVRMPGRPDERQFFYPHDNPSGYWWQGENARLASWAAASRRFLLSGSSGEQTIHGLEDFADAQIAWIFGLNPFDACMLQGHGKNNPPYEWDHFNVPGGVVNGVTSGFKDEDDIAFMPAEAAGNGDHSWRWGEQWIPHAAWLLLAVAWSVPAGD
ncbi:MAG: glycoside hydrolase family 9 protein [Spirochaetaceae bacterium]|nr:glycoside hydrolase family 9 protein [Spirochaetaceae bacterium]